MENWNRAPLRCSGRYFYEGDVPFFWLADTAWLMLQKLDEEDAAFYLENRKRKGFNVIMAVLVHTLPGVSMSGCSLAPGIKDVKTEAYWEFVDHMVDKAAEMGLYLGLLPFWGSLVKDGILNEDNIGTYAEFLGKRYQKKKNIIWILGGDVRGDVAPEIFETEARILKKYNPERLIGFHPFGRTSSKLWFQDKDFLDFDMFQSGHRRYDQASLGRWDDNRTKETFFGEDNWRYVDRDLQTGRLRPTLDGEPSYEGILQGLHDVRQPYWEEQDVRRYAWWSVLEGAAGHTYGDNAIMQFYTEADGVGAYGVRESWKEAIHHAGSGQLQFLKNLMEEIDFSTGNPRDDMLLAGQRERYHRIAVFAGKEYILCYDYEGDAFSLDLSEYQEIDLEISWMDPRNGVRSYEGSTKGAATYDAVPAVRRNGANDWVLILKNTSDQ